MSWKDRSKETQAVWSGLALCAVAAMVITFYLIAGREANTAKAREVAYTTDTGNIRYHAKRIQEGL